MKEKKATKISLPTILLIVILTVGAIFLVKYLLRNNQNNEQVNNTQKQATTLQTKDDYSGKMVSEEEVRSNREKDEKIEGLVQELITADDMVSFEYGFEPYNNKEQDEELSEKEKEERKKMASERYYRERAEILEQLKELLK